MCINWVNSVVFLSWRLNYCVTVFSCHSGPSQSVSVISFACSVLHRHCLKPFRFQLCGDSCPQVVSHGFWTEKISLQLACLEYKSSCCLYVPRFSDQMSSSTRSSLRGSSWREKKEGTLTSGFAQTVLELLGLLACGVGCVITDSCLQDPTGPRLGYTQHWLEGWHASWSSSYLWIPVIPLFARALGELSVVLTCQCKLWAKSITNICFLWLSTICSLGCSP